MGYAALFFKVKPKPELDFFSDPPPDSTVTERQSWIMLHTLQKSALDSTVASVFQSLSLGLSPALYSGTVQARSLLNCYICAHPKFLCKFLWRFSQASDQQRGYDLTVQMATQTEQVIFKEAISRKVEEQLGSLLEKGIPDYNKMSERWRVVNRQAALEDALMEHCMPNVVTMISMVTQNSDGVDKPHRVLISRPVTSPLSVASRGTWSYWALDVTTHRVVFLKDTWRHDVERITLEGEILKGLNELSVQFVPEVLYHGDVPHINISESSEPITMQCTRTHEYSNNEWKGQSDMDCSTFRGQMNSSALPMTYFKRYWMHTQKTSMFIVM
ncbi:hypothetical protein A0H81_09163 [Grifola frondosa]|uniref:Fungal-type protein kinase domain-containing protein n=1 Tax=Grifola frondosa TaxID=5627 RepID=A0A1C7M142_GRIFR|nr:hypothetical protein A0H81_09163 [Grifola frondosa]